MLLFTKNCSYCLNLVFIVLFVISRTKKNKKLRHVWFLFFKNVLCSKKQREYEKHEKTRLIFRNTKIVFFMFSKTILNNIIKK